MDHEYEFYRRLIDQFALLIKEGCDDKHEEYGLCVSLPLLRFRPCQRQARTVLSTLNRLVSIDIL